MAKVQAFFYNIFQKFNNDLYFEKVRLQQFRKVKYSILASILRIFQFSFLTERHIYLYNKLCKSRGFLISFFESGNIFKKA